MNIIHGDCLEELKKLDDNSIDAVVCDPPYGLSNTKPQQVADVLKAWVTGDDERVPSVLRKGRKNCLSQIILRTQGDSDGEDALARKDFVNVPITFSGTGFPMFGAVDFNDDSSFREIEVNDVSPEFTLDDELVNGFFSEFGKERQNVEFRLWALKGCPGCVGVCTCLTESSQGVGTVPVRLGYYALADAESATPVVTLRVTEVSAVLSFDRRRRSFELSPAGSAGEGDGLVLIVSPKGVGAVTGAGGLATVLESGLVGGVGGAADGACSADLVTHVDLLDRLVNPSIHPVGFMGKSWDGFVPPPAVWKECMRVLKPGGHMAVFAGARTQDLMGLSIRLAGFRIKDTLGWIFGSGFPKSHNPFKGLKLCPSIENAPHAVQVSEWHHHELSGAKEPTALALAEIMPGGERALLIKTGKEESLQELTVMYLSDTTEGTFSNIDLSWQKRSEESWRQMSMSIIKTIADQITESKTLNFSQSKSTEKCTLPKGIGEHGLNCRVARVVSFSGESDGSTSDTLMPAVVDAVTSPVFGMRSQGTQIKPAIEPIILAQKPLDGTVANNVLAHGVGGLNIDACRVGTMVGGTRTNGSANDIYGDLSYTAGETWEPSAAGRFPANVLLDEHAAKEMDKQSGVSVSKAGGRSGTHFSAGNEGVPTPDRPRGGHNDSGGASRFFPVFKYQAKAPKKERPVIEREDGTKIQHATVKPLALMEWLVSLIVPPGGVVLDPFAGSGTTLQAALNKGFTPIGIEQDADYIKLIEKRLEATCTTHKN